MQIDLALFVFLSHRRTHAHDTTHRSHACRTYCIQTLQTLLPHRISFSAVLGLSGLLLTFRIKAVLGLRAILLTFRIKPVLGLSALLLTFRIKPVLGLNSCYFSYSQDRLCSASCRKSSFFHALLENCHAPQYLATRQHNIHHSINFAIFFARFFSLRDRRDGILKKTNQTRQAFGIQP